MPELPPQKERAHPFRQAPANAASAPAAAPPRLPYADLHVTSNFTFLTGASHPDELVRRAAELGHAAAAITDVNTLAGVVRAHTAAKQVGIPLAVGCRVEMGDGGEGTEGQRDRGTKGAATVPSRSHFVPLSLCPFVPPSLCPSLSVLVFPTSRAAYGRLCRMLTVGKRRAEKGQCRLELHDLIERQEGMLAVVVPPAPPLPLDEEFIEVVLGLKRVFDDDRLSIAASRGYGPDDAMYLRRIAALAEHTGVPLAATNDVHHHVPERRALQDVVTCIRLGCTIGEAGLRLFANAERHMKPPEEMLRLFAEYPAAVARAAEVALRAAKGFNLDQLRYEYPDEVCPAGRTPMQHLAELTWAGAVERYGGEGGEGQRDRGTEGQRGSGAEAIRTEETDRCEISPSTWFAPAERRETASQGRYTESTEVGTEGTEGISDFKFEISNLKFQIVGSSISTPPQAPEAGELAFTLSLCPSVPLSLLACVPRKVRAQIEHELRLIDELAYAPYFLTVHDLVVYARSRGILCQGRGAAANSAVCYCLGVTSVDPDRIDVLFERFVSRERDEPPDIDIDFEHERREEVIQYIYAKYGRDRAALTAEVISYRGRSAVREVGKAMGLSLDCVDRMAKNLDWWEKGFFGGAPMGESGNAAEWQSGKVKEREARLRELGLNPEDPVLRKVIALTHEILGFPRHLSQHVGGFVITRGPLCESVPIENAAMEDRTVIEWDKDDIDALGMLKVDVLGLGMLTAIRKCLDLVNQSGKVAKWQSGKVEEPGEVRREVGPGVIERRTHSGYSHVPRPDRLAEGHEPHSHDLSCHNEDAEVGDLQPDESDAAGGVIDSDEHCRGVRETHAAGVHQGTANGHGFALRALDRLRDRDRSDDADPRPIDREPARGGGPDVAIPDLETGRQNACGGSGEEPAPQAMNGQGSGGVPHHFATLPLCHFTTSPLQLHTIPPEDPAVYDMICHADTVGVFQIESRAQMSMLPRLRPRCFYDLVIEVAIVRPGPIQGDMVHPYLRRRSGQEPVSYPSEAVQRVLKKTLGVPLFQEQAMSLAMVAAGFTAGEADQLRRAIAAWKSRPNAIQGFRDKLIGGMLARGYEPEFAERCFKQIQGFSGYGFPESHAASFALLVYASAWLKKHHPAAFAAALINSQPMGFYAPAQIVRDAKEHGVEVRQLDVGLSGWDCKLESLSSSPVLRLGMRLVRGLSETDGRAIEAAVARHGSFRSVEALWRASGVKVAALRRLGAADAFGSMGLDRQAALWAIRELKDEELPLFDRTSGEVAEWQSGKVKTTNGSGADLVSSTSPHCHSATLPLPFLPAASPVRQVVQDYAAIGLSLKAHPMSFLRRMLAERGVTPAAELRDQSRRPTGSRIAVAGIVLVRQRPATASGIVFMTLEDETGVANLIVRPKIYQRFRRAARHGVVVMAQGTVERQGEVIHVLVSRITSADHDFPALVSGSRDFH